MTTVHLSYKIFLLLVSDKSIKSFLNSCRYFFVSLLFGAVLVPALQPSLLFLEQEWGRGQEQNQLTWRL